MAGKSNIEWGKPSIDRGLCTVCGLCAKVCPMASIVMDDGNPVVRKNSSFGCIACGQCMAVCASEAVSVDGRGLKKKDAFPLRQRSERATPEALSALLDARRSVRQYKDTPVDQKTIDRLLVMASTAPMGFPPSEVGIVIINGKDRVQELAADLCTTFKKWLFLGTPLGSIMMNLTMDKDTRKLMKDFILPIAVEMLEGRKNGQDFLFYNAPCVILFHYPMKDTIDPAIACSFATIAAEALGLGSCMIGTAAHGLEGDKKLKIKWGIPEDRHPSIAMIIGHPDVEYHRGVRRHFASVSVIS